MSAGTDLFTRDAYEPDPELVRIQLSPLVLAVGALAVVLLVGAFVLALGAYLGRGSGEVDRAAVARAIGSLQADLDRLERRAAALEQENASLASRLEATEKEAREAATRGAGSLAPLASRVLRSVFTIETRVAYGSGFVAWTAKGATYILTANHVVEDSPSPFVKIDRRDGSWSGEIVATDPANDLALIRVAGTIARADPLWQDPGKTVKPRPGDQLLLVGSPYGLDGTVTTGVVSRVTKKEIQTDAAANPGNSGGPAVDRQGRVVAVLVAGAGENINFAVPIGRACVKLRDC